MVLDNNQKNILLYSSRFLQMPKVEIEKKKSRIYFGRFLRKARVIYENCIHRIHDLKVHDHFFLKMNFFVVNYLLSQGSHQNKRKSK